MRMLCVDDEPLMLKMLEMAIKEVKPDADVTAYRFQDELLEDAKANDNVLEDTELINRFLRAGIELDEADGVLDSLFVDLFIDGRKYREVSEAG